MLATFPLFKGVSKRRLRKLTANATLAEFAPGETIILAGDPDDRLYIILSGRAQTTPRGDQQVFGIGDYFGVLAVIDRRPRSATVVATSHAHVMKLPSRPVLELARRHPAITFTLLAGLTARLRQVESRETRAAAAG